jgi:hypothetical protein
MSDDYSQLVGGLLANIVTDAHSWGLSCRLATNIVVVHGASAHVD